MNYLAILRDLSRLASTTADPDRFLAQAVHEVGKAVAIKRVKVLRYRPDHGDLLVIAGIGWKEGIVGKATLPIDLSSPPGRAIQIGRVLTIENLPASTDYKLSGLLADHDIVSVINAPIAVEGTVWGVLEADSREARIFTEDTADFMGAVANMIGAAMQRKHFEEQALEAEAETARELGRREILLREMQHRIKNNFQTILSMLMIQKAQTVGSETIQVLNTLAERVSAIALAHDQLDPAQGLRVVNLATYLGALCRQIGGYSQLVTVETDLEDEWMPIDTAVALGIIVNELVTNAIKHAFDGPGIIVVQLRSGGGMKESCLAVIDDGKGMGPPRPGSSGTNLIDALAKQLRGRVERSAPGAGSAIKVYYPPSATT